MKEFTLKEELKECVRIWKYLARTGKRNKPAYTNKYMYACPICEYVWHKYPDIDVHSGTSDRYMLGCAKVCPMKSIWISKKGCDGGDESPYSRWVDSRYIYADIKGRKAAAKEIQLGAQKLLDELEENNKI